METSWPGGLIGCLLETSQPELKCRLTDKTCQLMHSFSELTPEIFSVMWLTESSLHWTEANIAPPLTEPVLPLSTHFRGSPLWYSCQGGTREGLLETMLQLVTEDKNRWNQMTVAEAPSHSPRKPKISAWERGGWWRWYPWECASHCQCMTPLPHSSPTGQ